MQIYIFQGSLSLKKKTTTTTTSKQTNKNVTKQNAKDPCKTRWNYVGRAVEGEYKLKARGLSLCVEFVL